MFPSVAGIKDLILEALDKYQEKGNPPPDPRDAQWLDFLAARISSGLEEYVEERRA